MSRRRRKVRSGEEVQLNLAAMLDMAFQLLTFFILTFKPAPVEGEILLRMPPPESMRVQAGKRAGSDTSSTDVLQGFDTVTLTIRASRSGDIAEVFVEQDSAGKSMASLNDKLSKVIGDPNSKFTQVLISVDPNLKYDGLMRVVDVCTRQKLPDGSRLGKMTFIISHRQ
jgi:biopolymer transport protein ExbD